MKPLTPVGSPSPLRLLNKGPEYLRRTMDGGGRGRSISAVERLEADKAKYVKSQAVINAKQEPVLAPCATPPPPARRALALTVPGGPPPSSPRAPPHPRPDPGRPPPRSRDQNENEEDEDDARKENRRVAGVDVEGRNRSNNANRAGLAAVGTPTATPPLPLVAPHSAPVLRRSTGKRMMRPDSLVIYRQKKECKTPSGGAGGAGAEVKGYGFVRRLFQGSMRERSGGGGAAVDGGSPKMVIGEERAPSRDGDSRMSWTNESGQEGRRAERRPATPAGTCALERTKNEAFPNGNNNGNAVGNVNGNVVRNAVGNVNGNAAVQDCGDPWERAVVLPRRGAGGKGGLQRSKSDLRLRGSLALSDHERFFDFCGLDLELVERLGPQNFLSGASSADTLSLILRSGGGGGSDTSEFSRHSGDGLFQEELSEQLPTGVSIIERNARVIKWLYSCRNAVHEGPKESTV